VRSSLALLLLLAGCVCQAADTIAVLPMFNKLEEKSPNLDWIGESVAETLRESLGSSGVLVLDREAREEVYRRLAVRASVVLTKATVIKIGETLDAGHVVFGDFSVDTPESAIGQSAIGQANIRIAIHAIDLKKLHELPAIEQSGPLENLSQMELRLAWLLLQQLAPGFVRNETDFLRDRPPVRLDAKESYIRGLMAANQEQRIRLFTQAAKLDDHFSEPNFQIGRILFGKRDYKTAAASLMRVTRGDSHYLEASFLLGICRYHEGDFDAAARQFRMVAAEIPLNEVFNNLGAALSRKGDSGVAEESFQKALQGDEGDPDYWFNTGYAMWKQGRFAAAADKFRGALDRSPGDQDATVFLGRCLKQEGPRTGDPRSEGRERIKTRFEDSAFRQLQAELRGRK